MKMKVLLASNNGHKIKEIKEILGDFFDVVSLREAGVESDPEETGATFEENARIKAVAGMKASGMPCIADDSGLEVFALDGLPGVMSARYAGGHGDDSANNEKLLRELENASDRSARYVCVICMAFPNGHEIVARGECRGTILKEARGEGGFGYDPLFFFPQFGKTFAEITAEEKNEVSHRKAALREFEKIWEKENG
ncbi:MAG: XTP/dITP diphosphatase [Eubacteriales bacterium]|nr:XTP/dITP diphosphatase [Clostridiales bacterium]MDD6342034.1 XTP/dITP diphosphatase [Eubacteriales bacterium]MDD7393292.1 XTP/dITP diphosphatase [Eubacteriales bacterium]MDY3759816.1 XTP/dITP diphosphatase [Eubacteriales bacterium]